MHGNDVYGPHTNEELVGRAVAGRRDEFEIATKFGFVINPDAASDRATDGSPENARHCRSEDIVPIPGTKSPQRLEENAAAVDVTLSAEDVEVLDIAISREAVHGDRYPEPMMAQLNN